MTTEAPIKAAPLSESAAAKILGIHRATLQLWRSKNLINPKLLAAVGPIRPASRTRPIWYDREMVEGLASGTIDQDELFAVASGYDPDAA